MRIAKLFRNTIKATCDVAVRAGEGEGAFLVVLPLAVEPSGQNVFADWLRNAFFPNIVRLPGIVAAIYGEHDASTRDASARALQASRIVARNSHG